MKKNNLFALGVAASLAATGCDNNKAEPVTVTAETVNAPAQSAQPQAPAKPEAAKLTSKLTAEEEAAVCSKLYPAVGPRFAIVEDGTFSVVDCTRKEVTQILNGCNGNYNDNVASIVDAKCSRDGDMYRKIDITAIINEDGTRKKGVYTYSDRDAKTSIELNPHSAKNFLYNTVTGTDRFSPTAKIWWPNLSRTRAVKASTPVAPTTPAKRVVEPPKGPSNKDAEQDRRLSALEGRVDGHDVAISKIQVSVTDLMKKKPQNPKDGHSIAADAVK